MSKVYDEDYKINIQTVLSELEWLPMYDSQISLQTVEGHKGDPDYGTGKLNKLNHIESDFTVPLFLTTQPPDIQAYFAIYFC